RVGRPAGAGGAPPPPPPRPCDPPLPRLGQHLLRVEAVSDLPFQPESIETAGSEDDCVERALLRLAQTRVDVPAQGLDYERRLDRKQLCPAAYRRRADTHPGPQRGCAAESVAGILPSRIRPDHQTGGIRRGHV